MGLVTNGTRFSQTEIPNRKFSNFFVNGKRPGSVPDLHAGFTIILLCIPLIPSRPVLFAVLLRFETVYLWRTMDPFSTARLI